MTRGSALESAACLDVLVAKEGSQVGLRGELSLTARLVTFSHQREMRIVDLS